MQQTIKEFSGKCITSVKNWHSSTVEFTFTSPGSASPSITETTEDTDKGHSPSLTLDFCVWDLVYDKKLLISSNDDELERKLSMLIGDTISRIAQLTRFREIGENQSGQGNSDYFTVRVTFGSGKKLFIAPHDYEEEPDRECEPSRLMTLLAKSSQLIYRENGEIQHSLR